MGIQRGRSGTRLFLIYLQKGHRIIMKYFYNTRFSPSFSARWVRDKRRIDLVPSGYTLLTIHTDTLFT